MPGSTFKIYFSLPDGKQEIRRFTSEARPVLPALLDFLTSCYSKFFTPPLRFQLSYEDDEGDMCSADSEAELQEGLSLRPGGVMKLLAQFDTASRERQQSQQSQQSAAQEEVPSPANSRPLSGLSTPSVKALADAELDLLAQQQVEEGAVTPRSESDGELVDGHESDNDYLRIDEDGSHKVMEAKPAAAPAPAAAAPLVSEEEPLVAKPVEEESKSAEPAESDPMSLSTFLAATGYVEPQPTVLVDSEDEAEPTATKPVVDEDGAPSASPEVIEDVTYSSTGTDLSQSMLAQVQTIERLYQEQAAAEKAAQKAVEPKVEPKVAEPEVAESESTSAEPAVDLSQSTLSLPIHVGYTCDGCQEVHIVGNRYRCATCTHIAGGFDLCQACLDRGDKHPASHSMVKAEAPKRTDRDTAFSLEQQEALTMLAQAEKAEAAKKAEEAANLAAAQKLAAEQANLEAAKKFAPLCPYGLACYRTNPVHRAEYQHVGRPQVPMPVASPVASPVSSPVKAASSPKPAVQVTSPAPASASASASASPSSSAAAATGPVVHSGITCDGCRQTPLTGVRYHCTTCRMPGGFDLCEACEAAGDKHSPDHVMMKMRVPAKDVPHAASMQMATSGAGARCPFRGQRIFAAAAASTARPKAQFISDVTLADGLQVHAGETLRKVWSVKNVGNEAWPAGTQLVFAGGDLAPESEGRADEFSARVPFAGPGDVVHLAIDIQVPPQAGRFRSTFRLQTADGHRFGPRIWLDLHVPQQQQQEAAKEEPKPAEQAKAAVVEVPVVVQTPAAAAPVAAVSASAPPAGSPPSVAPVAAESKQVEDAALAAEFARAQVTAVTAPAASAAAPAAAAPKSSSPAFPFSNQLAVLRSMGFTDAALCKYLLLNNQGNLERVVQWLLTNAGGQ